MHRDVLGSCGHFVATYEELGTRLSAGSIEVSDLAAVIIDEACDLDEDCGGNGALDLEMLIARLRSAGSSCPQIVALTTLASADVAKKMASWLGAKVVDACGAEGRPGCAVIGTRESVCHNGMLHFRSAPGSREPLPRDLRCGGGAAGGPDVVSLCARFARRAVVDDFPVLISVPPGSDVIGFASEVASQLRRIEGDDLDMGEAAGKKAALRQSLVGRPAIGAGIEYCGTGSESPLASGVAFDDERLPPAFRKAVMRGVEGGAISALVSSSVPCTRDAPSPFKTVLLCRPAAGGEIPTAFEYARATEMAGRAGLDRKGETIVAAASQAEYDVLRRSLWDVAPSVTSGLGGSRDDLRPRIALHLIRMAKELGGATPGDMASRISATWFWASSSASDKAALDETIRGLLDELVALDLVVRDARGTSAGHIYRPTDFGNLVCESHLPVLHAASTVRKLRGIRDDDDAPALQLCSDLALGGMGSSACPSPDQRTSCDTKAGGDAHPSRLVAAKSEAVASARMLLGLADLLNGMPEPAGGACEAVSRAAVRCMSDSFGAAASLLARRTAKTERERAEFLMSRLAAAAPRLREISPQGDSPPLGLDADRLGDAGSADALLADPDAAQEFYSFEAMTFVAAPLSPEGSRGRQAHAGALRGTWKWWAAVPSGGRPRPARRPRGRP